jgi:hypothetical protein
MRRIDVFTIGIAIFGIGGLAYLVLEGLGVDNLSAGVWTQFLLVVGLIVWGLTYLRRVATHNMTYHKQREDYENAFFEKRLAEMTPEELAQFQAELEQEKKAANKK